MNFAWWLAFFGGFVRNFGRWSGGKHPSREMIFGSQNLAKKKPRNITSHDILEPLKTSAFGITWCDHVWPNLQLEVAKGFHIRWWMQAAQLNTSNSRLVLYPWGSVDLGEGVSGPKTKKSPNSLEKVSRARVPKVQKKSRKRSKKKAPKTRFQTFVWPFGPFRDFFGLLVPGAGRLFQDFLGFGPDTDPRSAKPQLYPTPIRNAFASPLQGVEIPKIGKRGFPESKNPHFPPPRKGRSSQIIPHFYTQSTSRKMGIFWLGTPFSGVVGYGGFLTPKPSFPDFWGFLREKLKGNN